MQITLLEAIIIQRNWCFPYYKVYSLSFSEKIFGRFAGVGIAFQPLVGIAVLHYDSSAEAL